MHLNPVRAGMLKPEDRLLGEHGIPHQHRALARQEFEQRREARYKTTILHSLQLGLLNLAAPVAVGAPPPVDKFLREGRIEEGLTAYASAANNPERFSLAILQALGGLQRFSASMSTLGISPEFVRSGIPFLRVVMPYPQQSSNRVFLV